MIVIFLIVLSMFLIYCLFISLGQWTIEWWSTEWTRSTFATVAKHSSSRHQHFDDHLLASNYRRAVTSDTYRASRVTWSNLVCKCASTPQPFLQHFGPRTHPDQVRVFPYINPSLQIVITWFCCFTFFCWLNLFFLVYIHVLRCSTSFYFLISWPLWCLHLSTSGPSLALCIECNFLASVSHVLHLLPHLGDPID